MGIIQRDEGGRILKDGTLEGRPGNGVLTDHR